MWGYTSAKKRDKKRKTSEKSEERKEIEAQGVKPPTLTRAKDEHIYLPFAVSPQF